MENGLASFVIPNSATKYRVALSRRSAGGVERFPRRRASVVRTCQTEIQTLRFRFAFSRCVGMIHLRFVLKFTRVSELPLALDHILYVPPPNAGYLPPLYETRGSLRWTASRDLPLWLQMNYLRVQKHMDLMKLINKLRW